MISGFKTFLVEEEKTIFFTFGRMNPPTIGHEKLLNVLSKKAGSSPYRVYLSQSQDKKKNPLDYKTKVKFARKMFPRYARQIMLNPKIKTVFDAMTALYDEGYKSVVMVVGADRVNEFDVLLKKYNGTKGRHGFYNFERINVVSAGSRDPDAEGVEGMSASKMREAAASGNFTQFSQGMPKSVSNADAKSLFNMVRKGMGLNEAKTFTNHIQLEKVSDKREAYISGDLFEAGDYVLMPDEDKGGYITYLGANYVIVEASDKKYRKWIDDVVLFEKKNTEDPDIGHRKGSQPAGYHKGLSKSTKVARDRQFKKQSKMDDDNPAAYKPAPGDKTAKTKPSKHTKKYKQMYGEQTIDQVRDRIAREKEVEKRRDAADRKRQDRMLDQARSRRTRRINRGTDQS